MLPSFHESQFFSLKFPLKSTPLFFQAYDKENEQTVAIKKMNFSGKQATEKWNDILKEVSFLKTVVHKHIVDYKACFLKETTCWVSNAIN